MKEQYLEQLEEMAMEMEDLDLQACLLELIESARMQEETSRDKAL